jgi:hypothetical protein
MYLARDQCQYPDVALPAGHSQQSEPFFPALQGSQQDLSLVVVFLTPPSWLAICYDPSLYEY